MQRLTDAELHDALSRIGNQARSAARYLDINKTRYVHLVDGGVSDNLALRSAGLAAQNMAQSAPGAGNVQLDHIRRLLVLSVDGEGAQDTSVAQRRLVGGIFSLFGLVSGAQIDRYNFETLTTVSDQLRQLVAAVARNRCSEAKVIDGTDCDDVKGALIHISLTELPDSPTKDRLQAIPTGLTIRRDDVDALIGAGRTAILTSVPLRDFLENYPPTPPEEGPGHARLSENAGRSWTWSGIHRRLPRVLPDGGAFTYLKNLSPQSRKEAHAMRRMAFATVIIASTALPAAVHAQATQATPVTEDNFLVRNTGDLVALCDAQPNDRMYTAAQNFCHGFAVGEYRTLLAMQSGQANPLFCVPTQLPSRSQAIADFIQWARASPARLQLSAADGLASYLADKAPCKSRGSKS